MKTVCVYHSIDLDGWMSAAIVKHWFVFKNKDHIIFNSDTIPSIIDSDSRVSGKINENELYFMGYNYGQPIPDLSGYDQVIMCDISFPIDEMERLRQIFQDKFIWIDHHISVIKDVDSRNNNYYDGIRNTKFAACELTWLYFMTDPNKTHWDDNDVKNMPEIVRLLGRYDCFGHKGTDEEERVLIFQYAARAVIKNYEDAYYFLTRWSDENLIPSMMLTGDGIYSYLKTDAAQSYKNGVELTFGSGTTNIPLKFICINKERFNPINFGIDYHADGYDGAACFYLRADGKWSFSLYNDNGLVDCSVIAKQFGGGGHKGASGFVVDDINSILNR